jgi:hypothetical protein
MQMFFKKGCLYITFAACFIAAACAKTEETEILIETSPTSLKKDKEVVEVHPINIYLPEKTINVEIPEESIKVNVPNINVKVPENSILVNLPTIKVDLTVPNEAIKITFPNQTVNLKIPKDSINLQMKGSPLLWITVIVSVITLILSIITLLDRIKKEKKEDNKSVFDDYWFRNVIHPECLKAFSSLVDNIKKDINEGSVDQSIHGAKASLHNLELLPGGKDTQIILSESLIIVEDDIALYRAYKEEGLSKEDVLSLNLAKELLTDDINNYCNRITLEFHTELVKFHKQLLINIV